MAENVSSDATPFPDENKAEFAKAPSPTSDHREKKERPRKLSSTSSSDSDFDDLSSSHGRKDGNATVININKAQDVHIGHRFTYSSNVSYTSQQCTESDYGASSPANTNYKGSKPSQELLNSARGIDPDDMYIVAENISRHWKKLARFLDPGDVFSDGQLKTFEDNNPHNQEEAIYEMLKTWKQQHPENATIGVLAKTLWTIGKADIAQKLKP